MQRTYVVSMRNLLLGDRGKCVLTTCLGLHSTAGRLGFDPRPIDRKSSILPLCHRATRTGECCKLVRCRLRAWLPFCVFAGEHICVTAWSVWKPSFHFPKTRLATRCLDCWLKPAHSSLSVDCFIFSFSDRLRGWTNRPAPFPGRLS